jgi:glutathione synthase/RimK-type ligase-like ATP-grasp enzyme
MILVAGIMADGLIELMCARLEDMNYKYMFLDELRYPGDFNATWTVSGNGAPGDPGGCRVRGYVEGPGGKVDLRDVTGIYARYVHHKGTRPPEGYNEREQEIMTAEYQASLMSLIDAMPCVVVNRVKASTSNDSKLYQEQLVSQYGFLTPRTLVTTSPQAAEAFYEDCNRKVIYKSVSSVRSIVRRLKDADLPRLDSVRNCPTQFQEWVEGVDIRVHVVGDETFATELVSEASDYRYASRSGDSLTAEAIDIPPDIAGACVGLAKDSGLMVAGIDLRRTPDGRYYCFEMNPSPGFLFYERATGQPISEAVANLLRNA